MSAPPRISESSERLREEHDGEQRAEERLEVGEQRRPPRADAVHGREPEDVRKYQRPDDRKRKAGPDEPVEIPVLVRQLLAREQHEREPHQHENSRRDAVRRVLAHEGRDRDRVRCPGRRHAHRDEDAAELARERAACADGDERDAAERHAAASQKRRVGCSIPVSDENSPVKIGIVPRISATVVAFARRSE